MNAATARSVLVRLTDRSGHAYGFDPSARDEPSLAELLEVLGHAFGDDRYFGVDLQGLDGVPEGPVMLVGNHSGGTTALDAWGFFYGWYRHFGVERPLYGLAHELVFGTPATGRWFERTGLLRARRDTAERVLVEEGAAVMVMPGGDRDVWRAARRRHRVTFAGRTGYAATALRLGVPIVPVSHVGAHHTLHVFTSGHRLARHLGLQRLVRASIWPVHLSLPWGLAFGPWPHLPPPVRLSYRVGAPLHPEDFTDADDPVAALDTAARQAVQRGLDGLRDVHPVRDQVQHLLSRSLRRALRR